MTEKIKGAPAKQASTTKVLRPFFDEKRAKALETEAMKWTGTPYIPNLMVKGRGVDCCRLPIALYQAFGLFTYEGFKMPEYKAFQDGEKSLEMLVSELKKGGFQEDPRKGTQRIKDNDVFAPACGSLVVFRVGRERKLHVGLALTSGFLHVMPGKNTRRDGFNKAWRDRVESVWVPSVETK